MHRGFESGGARRWAALTILAGVAGGCAEAPGGRGNTKTRTDGDDAVALQFEVIGARAYPADATVRDTSLTVSIDPCQSQLHIALGEDDALDDYDIEFADEASPTLVLIDEDGDEFELTDGMWLQQSITFALDPDVLQAMGAGVFEGELMMDGVAVAAIPGITRVATGDANRDGVIDSKDLVAIFQAGTYETGAPATFSTGDFDCDGDADSADLVKLYQSPEGVTYEGAPYVGPGDEPAWVDDGGKLMVTDYQCWLVAYGPSKSRLKPPSADRPDRHLLDYSGMSVEHGCTDLGYHPDDFEAGDEPSSMVLYDARVSHFVTSECAYGGWDLEDANEHLADIGESWSAGKSTITSEGNAARDVRLVCEPFYNTIDDVYGDLFDDNTMCRMDFSGTAKGKAVSTAYADIDSVTLDVGGEVRSVAEAKTTSELLLQFPDLSDITPGSLEDVDATPGTLEAHGTAVADANGSSSGNFNLGDNAKCSIGFEGSWFNGPDVKAGCTLEVTAKEAYEFVDDLIESFGAEGETVEQTVHVAWANKTGDDIGNPRTLTNTATLSIRPVSQGPVRGKALGNLRVYSKQVAMSSSELPALGAKTILASDATGYADGSVTISVDAYDPDVPDEYYDEWNEQQKAAWDAEHESRCQVGGNHRKFDGLTPGGPEPEIENFVIRERGSSITLGTSHFDRRYWISRDGETIESYFERFGVW